MIPLQIDILDPVVVKADLMILLKGGMNDHK
jgi:hypothetical protein